MRLQLQFRSGHHAGHVLEFTAPRVVTLGRSSQSDVQIYDERISRRHCQIALDDAGARVRDLSSGNGTYVNGVEVRETALADGDLLMLGRTEICLRMSKAPAMPAPPPVGTAAYTAFHPGQLNLSAQGQPAPPPPAPWASPATAPAGPVGAGLGAVPPQFAARPTVTEGQQPVCALCRQVIPAPDLVKSVEHRGTWLCPRCAPRVEIPGYQIERVLGEGANGVVYLARWLRPRPNLNLPPNVPVALKVLKVRGQLTDEERKRFIREASVAAELEHRNIVRVLDLAQADPYIYYSMEFVQGKSLKEWIKEHGPLPLPAVLRIAVQVALALEHAREHNIVHRDIKPENILVQPDGVAKLTDFGLAKNFLSAGTSNLTRPGDGLGTLPFMPPEQIENAISADHRSDIYSFGASIYNMLTGRPPFAPPPGGRWATLDYFTNIRDQSAPPIAQFRGDVPRVIQVMVEKALSKKPEDRYQQIAEMLALLQQFLRTEFDSRQTAT